MPLIKVKKSIYSMRKIQIVFILPSAELGGAERVVFSIINNLDRLKFCIFLILLKSSGPLIDHLRSDVEVISLDSKKITFAIGSIIKLLRKLKPDLIFSTHVHINIALLAARSFLPQKTKIIIRESNVPSKKLNSELKNIIIRQLYQYTYHRAQAIICPGKAIRNDLLVTARINSDLIYEIPNPVNVDEIQKKMHEPLQIETKKDVIIVAAGSLTEQKGFDILIEAMAYLMKNRNNFVLLILGDGREKRNLKKLIKINGLENNIVISGLAENVYPYFYAADIFILSSRYEGLPNVVLESLVCGTPVIAFDCPGCVSEIVENGEQGILVEPENPILLSEAVDKMIKQRKDTKKKNLLSSRFTLGKVIKQYEDLFQNVSLSK